MESFGLPTPSNLSEITAQIVKSDMEKYESFLPIRSYSDAYLNGKKGFAKIAKNSRKRGATVDLDGGSSSSQPRPGPSHVITSFQITTTIKPIHPSTSTPTSHILPEWIKIVQDDIQAMKDLKKSSSYSDAYICNVNSKVHKNIFAQKIYKNPINSLKESTQKLMGENGQRIIEEIDQNDALKDIVRFTLAKKIMNKITDNPDCSPALREDILAVFK